MEPITIMVVDDERYMLDATKRILDKRFLGFETKILTALSAEEALQIIKDNKVDLLITDNKMPGMSGLELAMIIKKIRPEVPIIINSGDLSEKDVPEGIGFLRKPFEAETMKEKIYQLLKMN